ncbi:somatostatin 1, tandem duplicate 1 isoform X1 [Lates japonicus]|uniref:Somatostatin 1, tandem duplicate 1 isoform X1 n=1 Tax=Lates japonicus TaxID=270547 RepID=A0AAD3RMF1_LATJO|nr:somatostatin 1, tandem duplicate 1 isoform X1 [Lates japonicus]
MNGTCHGWGPASLRLKTLSQLGSRKEEKCRREVESVTSAGLYKSRAGPGRTSQKIHRAADRPTDGELPAHLLLHQDPAAGLKQDLSGSSLAELLCRPPHLQVESEALEENFLADGEPEGAHMWIWSRLSAPGSTAPGGKPTARTSSEDLHLTC